MSLSQEPSSERRCCWWTREAVSLRQRKGFFRAPRAARLRRQHSRCGEGGAWTGAGTLDPHRGMRFRSPLRRCPKAAVGTRRYKTKMYLALACSRKPLEVQQRWKTQPCSWNTRLGRNCVCSGESPFASVSASSRSLSQAHNLTAFLRENELVILSLLLSVLPAARKWRE